MLAIFALGLTATAEAADLIAPFLHQAPRRQHWASAICLGLMKDPRAFPVLETLLLDGLDLEEYRRAYHEEALCLHFCQFVRGSGRKGHRVVSRS